MGRLRKLRTRFISSIGAVKRSVLRRQSTTSSTASNPTTLTRLASLDSAVPSRRSLRTNTCLHQAQDSPEGEEEREHLQLHWNEARRIYSEPVQAIQGLSNGEDICSTTTTTVTDCRSLSCGAICEQCSRNSRNAQNLCGSTAEAVADGNGGCTHQLCSVEDDEDDDVFLQSWEDGEG